MKTLPYRVILIAVVLYTTCFSLAANFLPSVSLATLVPDSYVTLRGGSGGQPATNLAVMDQSGTDNNWDAYVEFTTPNGSTYSGYQVFTLPSSVPTQDITSLSFKVNFLGPLYSYQIWTWSIYNWGAASWVKLGTNATARDWVWTLMTFNIPSPYTQYINSSGKLRIHLKSNSSADNTDIDYEAILIGYDMAPPSTTVSATTSAPTLTSAPTSTVTKTPVPTVTSAPSVTPSASSWWQPGVNTSWQIQYDGTINTGLAVQVYNLDGFDTSSATIALLHLQGIKVMCYFSAGTWEDWRPDASNFPASVKGSAVSGWPGENWLDIRQANILLPLMEARIDMCKSKGFDGVDPDNIDGYTNNTGFPLSPQNQLIYNVALSNAAHTRGLAIGLKNDIDQIPDLVSHFDWQLNEQCFEYQECDKLLPFIQAGKPVFNIEYSLATTSFCPQANSLNFNSLKKKLSLDAFRVACR